MIRQFDSPAAMQAAGDSGTATFSGADSQLASGASPTGGLESVIFPTLPVVDKPDGMAPFVIAADGATTPASTYAILARVDAVILVVAAIFMFVFS